MARRYKRPSERDELVKKLAEIAQVGPEVVYTHAQELIKVYTK